jgi:hypothetical protein
MAKDTIIRTVRTKATEDDTAVETILTLDFSSLSEDDVYEIAAQSAVIKWQGNARRAKEIPTTATYKVPRPGTRGSAVVDYEAALTKVFGFKKVQLLKAKFGTAELAYAKLKPQLDMLMEDVETSEE